jgi:hypothetical protein
MRNLLHAFGLVLLFTCFAHAQAPTTFNNVKILSPSAGATTDSVLVWRGSGDKIVRFVPASDIAGAGGTGPWNESGGNIINTNTGITSVRVTAGQKFAIVDFSAVERASIDENGVITGKAIYSHFDGGFRSNSSLAIIPRSDISDDYWDVVGYLKYDDDYSADFDDRTLVDKEFVTNAISAGVGSVDLQSAADNGSTIESAAGEFVQLTVKNIANSPNSGFDFYNDDDGSEVFRFFNQDGFTGNIRSDGTAMFSSLFINSLLGTVEFKSDNITTGRVRQLANVSGTEVVSINANTADPAGNVVLTATDVGAVYSVTGTGGVTVATGTTTPVIGLGNITPTSVASTGTVTGTNLSGTNTGDNATNTTSNTYADGKVAATITDGVTTSAPNQDVVHDTFALKAPINNATFTGTTTVATGIVSTSNASSARIFTTSGGVPLLVNEVRSGTIGTMTGSASVITSSTTFADAPAQLQNQVSLKANLSGPTFTGTVVLPSTTSVGSVSSTELGYIDGVTSSIQTQFSTLSNQLSYLTNNVVASTANTLTLTSSVTTQTTILTCNMTGTGTWTLPTIAGNSGKVIYLTNNGGTLTLDVLGGGTVIQSGNTTSATLDVYPLNNYTIYNNGVVWMVQKTD